jgi:hypothetical protein
VPYGPAGEAGSPQQEGINDPAVSCSVRAKRCVQAKRCVRAKRCSVCIRSPSMGLPGFPSLCSPPLTCTRTPPTDTNYTTSPHLSPPPQQPGEYSYVLHYRDQYKLDPNGETGPADVLGRTRHINRLFVAPPCAFTLFYATGWPRCSLVYRIIEGPDAPEVGGACVCVCVCVSQCVCEGYGTDGGGEKGGVPRSGWHGARRGRAARPRTTLGRRGWAHAGPPCSGLAAAFTPSSLAPYANAGDAVAPPTFPPT